MLKAAVLELCALSSFSMFPSQYSVKLQFSECILKVTVIDAVIDTAISLGLTFF